MIYILGFVALAALLGYALSKALNEDKAAKLEREERVKRLTKEFSSK